MLQTLFSANATCSAACSNQHAVAARRRSVRAAAATGKLVHDDPDTGEPLFLAGGQRVTFRELSNKRYAGIERGLGNESPAKIYQSVACNLDFERLRQHKEIFRQSSEPDAEVARLRGTEFLLSPNRAKPGYPILITGRDVPLLSMAPGRAAARA